MAKAKNYLVPAYKCVLVRERSMRMEREITGTAAAIRLASEVLGDSPNEQVIVFSLDSKNKPIGMHVATVGVLDSSLVHPREIFRSAIILNASSVIVAHNHPSGDLTPSREDRKVAERLGEAGMVVGIELLDFIIVNDETGISFREIG